MARVIGACAAALFAVVLAWSPGPALAHAIVIESDPAAGAALNEPPARIYLRFNSKLEKRLSHVTLATANGRPVPMTIAAGGGERPDRIVRGLGRLEPGAYAIHYKVLAADGHITEGILRFSVRGPQ